jgi:hypothetical protein
MQGEKGPSLREVNLDSSCVRRSGGAGAQMAVLDRSAAAAEEDRV